MGLASPNAIAGGSGAAETLRGGAVRGTKARSAPIRIA